MARYYADWARGLGAACTVAAGGWEGRPPAPAGDARLLVLPWDAARSHRPVALLWARRILDREIAGHPPDVLLGGNVRPYAPLLLDLARRRRVPFVQVYHGNDLLRTVRRWRDHPLKRRRWRRLAGETALHVVNSRFSASLAAAAGLPPDRLHVVPPEVDTERFRPPASAAARGEARDALGWPRDAVVSLFAGRLVERKGLADLLAVLPELPPGNLLVVAGPGDVPAWEARACASGAADRVRFLGGVEGDRLPLCYRAADLFVGPSTERREDDDVEGFGIVFLEASASGLPVLAARSGGVPEAVEDGVTGVLVPPGDRRALHAAWGALAGDPARREALGTAGRETKARAHARGTSAARLREVLERTGLVRDGSS
jgi:glycosyltransferase involved in cell wall biosynthesis